ncbi:hypothetical protein KP509_38G003800 [Ceratopteris richardii]|uniref:CCHC-type domain-containing protein n=1 Tax=Ceratopteris richardii TaxID=49495 RepID=A0A8T2Q284_CERRI|nr:hypothetical protein KP509_38G003800 [Ceratopteris richardii]
MAFQKESTEAPSTAPGKTSLDISFTPEELLRLEAEIKWLTQVSIICRIVGSRPNRGELRDLLYRRLQLEATTIKDVQPLGKGYYQIEFNREETVGFLLTQNPLDLRGARAFFSPWHSGFNAAEATRNGEKIFKITALGIQLETEDMMASHLARSNGMPSVKLLVSEIKDLPEILHLPIPRGGRRDQIVEYMGLPNQCFECRQVGHIARDCPKRQHGNLQQQKEKEKTDKTQKNEAGSSHLGKHGEKQQDLQLGHGTLQQGESNDSHGWQQVWKKKSSTVDVNRGKMSMIEETLNLSNRYDALNNLREEQQTGNETQAPQAPTEATDHCSKNTEKSSEILNEQRSESQATVEKTRDVQVDSQNQRMGKEANNQ